MSDQVTTATTENTNQVVTEESKPAATTEATKTETAATATATTEVKVDAATTKATETPKVEDKTAPIAFEIKKADGSLVDAAQVEKIASFAKEHGLSNAQAQAIYNRENAAVTAFEADAVKQHNERKTQWIEEAKKSSILGGEHFDQNVQGAHLTLQRFSTPEFTKLLDETGFGNHPQLLEVFFNIHKATQDDSFVRAGSQSNDLKPTSEILYDNTNKGK